LWCRVLPAPVYQFSRMAKELLFDLDIGYYALRKNSHETGVQSIPSDL
jgi:hypothetical protein